MSDIIKNWETTGLLEGLDVDEKKYIVRVLDDSVKYLIEVDARTRSDLWSFNSVCS